MDDCLARCLGSQKGSYFLRWEGKWVCLHVSRQVLSYTVVFACLKYDHWYCIYRCFLHLLTSDTNEANGAKFIHLSPSSPYFFGELVHRYLTYIWCIKWESGHVLNGTIYFIGRLHAFIMKKLIASRLDSYDSSAELINHFYLSEMKRLCEANLPM